jgi:hypothetical protein
MAGGGSNRQGRQPVGHSAGPGLGRRVGRGCDAHAPVTPDRRSGMAAIRLATVTRRCEPAAGAPGAPHRLGGVGRLRRRAGMGASRNPAAVAPQAAGQRPPRPPRIRQHALGRHCSVRRVTSARNVAAHRGVTPHDHASALTGRARSMAARSATSTGLMSCLAGEEPVRDRAERSLLAVGPTLDAPRRQSCGSSPGRLGKGSWQRGGTRSGRRRCGSDVGTS